VSASEHASRHHIAHLQLVAPQDIPRFGDLGITANMQMFWAAEDDQVHELCRPLLGDARVDRQYPFASLLAGGAPAAAGSDWPVSTASVLAQIQVGVTRRPTGHPDRPPLAPEQALTVDRALRACTVGGARLHGREATLRPGARADLVGLDRDLYRIPADDIAAATVQVTVAGGSVVHLA
jgi:predicted amidohydrolase YtcJ